MAVLPAATAGTSVVCCKLFYGQVSGTMEHVFCSCPAFISITLGGAIIATISATLGAVS